MKAKIAGLVVMALTGLAAAFALAGTSSATHPTTTTSTGGGHTPVTICHKPGTPAENELVVDDDSVELTGHLGHGDTIGPCPTTTTTTTVNPCDTSAADQYEECNPPPTTTTPPSGDCPPGMIHDKGHDGNDGNDDCCFPGVDCDGDTPPSTTPPVTSTPPTTTVTEPPPVITTNPGETIGLPPVAPPKVTKPKPDKAPPIKTSSRHKTTKAPPVCPVAKPHVGRCAVQGSG